MRDETKAAIGFISLILVVLAVFLTGPILSVFAPCSWLGWMSVKDAPVRCLPHGEIK